MKLDALLHGGRSTEDTIVFNDERRSLFDRIAKVLFYCTFVALLGALLFYIYALSAIHNGSTGFSLLFSIFSDFVVIMKYSLQESPYLVNGSSYPPIAIFALYPFALICRGVFDKYAHLPLTDDELTSRVILSFEFWIALILFFLLSTLIVLLLLSRIFRIGKADFPLLVAVVVLSAPFVYAIMRGNTIYFALIFTLLFLLLKNHENRAMRELSYFCLALSGAIKIYPLFFGVFLLKDKKIFASIRVAIYFAICFFLPFLLLDGGLHDMFPFMDNLGGFMTNDVRLIANNNLSFTSILFKVLHFFEPFKTSGTLAFRIVNLTALGLLFLTVTVAAVITKSNFSRYIFCFAMVALIPSVSYYYITVFAILPFLSFVGMCDEMSPWKRRFYVFGFLFLFISFFVVFYFFVIHALVILAMLAIELYTVFFRELPARRVKL